jgi:hypothetical protein
MMRGKESNGEGSKRLVSSSLGKTTELIDILGNSFSTQKYWSSKNETLPEIC